MLTSFFDLAGLDALRTDKNMLCTMWRGNFDTLNVWLEQSVGDTGYFLSCTAFFLGHAATLDASAHHRSFST